MEATSCWMAARVALGAFQCATLRLAMAVWTLASAGRKLAIANPAGAGAAAATAGAAGGLGCLRSRRASRCRLRPGSKERVVRSSGGWNILSPDDNGEGVVATCGAFDGLGMLQQNKGCSSLCGPVAQLGARFHGMEEVIGSIPIRSTNQFNNLDRPKVPRPAACAIVFVITHRSGAGEKTALADHFA